MSSSRRNYVSVNAKYYKSGRASKINDHNYRISKVDYLLNEIDQKFKNMNYVCQADSINKKTFVENFEHLLDLKKMDQESRGYFSPKGKEENNIIEMVIGLSEEQALYYLNMENGEEHLQSGLKQVLMDLEEKYGFKGLGIDLHTDEGYYDKNGKVKYNIHAHITVMNYDFEKHRTVLRTLKQDDWANMQDVAQDALQKLGLDFIRGKEGTGKKHLDRLDYIIQQQQLTITEQIEKMKLLSIEHKKNFKSFTDGKNAIKEQRAKFVRGSEQFDKLTIKYNNIKDREQESRQLKRDLDSDIKKLEAEKLAEAEQIKINQNNANKKLAISKLELENNQNIINQHTNTIDSQIKQMDVLFDEKDELIAKNDDLNKQITTKKEIIAKDAKKADDIYSEKLDEIKKICKLGTFSADREKYDELIIEEFKKMSNLDVNVESARKDRLEKNEIELEKKDIEKRYVQSLKNNDDLEKSLKLEKQKHQETKDNSISKDIINNVLEKANMPNIAELEKKNKEKEDLKNEQKAKSRNSMRHR